MGGCSFIEDGDPFVGCFSLLPTPEVFFFFFLTALPLFPRAENKTEKKKAKKKKTENLNFFKNRLKLSHYEFIPDYLQCLPAREKTIKVLTFLLDFQFITIWKKENEERNLPR